MNTKIFVIPDKIFGIDVSMISSFLPLAGVIILAFLGINMIIIPKYNIYKEMEQNLVDIGTQNKNLLDKIGYIKSIDANELKKNSDFISSALLPQKNAYLLVDVVRKIADKYSFSVDSFSVSPGKLEKGEASALKVNEVPKIPIQVTLVGSKDNYLSLIKGLERSLPILSLNSFIMTSEAALVKLDLNISAFYLQDTKKYDIDKLTLADLTMEKAETELISSLNQYEVFKSSTDLEGQAALKGEFKKYTRLDPFSL